MNYLYTSLTKEKYLAAVKQRFSSLLAIFDGRVTGMILGPFFAVAHYQPYEWNRRITSECNRAYGFVKEVHGELEICYFSWKGLLAPGWVVFYTLLSRSMFLCYEVRAQDFLGFAVWILSVTIALFICLMTAVADSLTETGAAGADQLKQFLSDPENFYC